MFLTRLLRTGVLGLLLATTAQGSALTFLDDYEGFVEAAPTEVQVIDFETLPDGSPSYAPAAITPVFNYTHLGATFLPHRDPGLYIYGNPVGGFGLNADSYPVGGRNWIVAELVTPGSAVGTYHVSYATLSLFDLNGDLIAAVINGGAGWHFTGIVSEVPIAYATIDMGTSYAASDEFVFAEIPEPCSGLGLLIMSALGVRRRGHCSRVVAP